MNIDEKLKKISDIKKYEGYEFRKKGRWYAIRNGKFIMPGKAPPKKLNFVAAVDADKIEYFMDTLNINYVAENEVEPAPGKFLVIGYEGESKALNYLTRYIEDMYIPGKFNINEV